MRNTRIALPIVMSALLPIQCGAQAFNEEQYRAELTRRAKNAADIFLGNIVNPHAVNNRDGNQGGCPGRKQEGYSDFWCVRWMKNSRLGEFDSGVKNNESIGTASLAAANSDVAPVKKAFDDLKASVVAPWVEPLIEMRKELREGVKTDLTRLIDDAIKPELRQQIIDAATKAAAKQIMGTLCEQGVISGSPCQR